MTRTEHNRQRTLQILTEARKRLDRDPFGSTHHLLEDAAHLAIAEGDLTYDEVRQITRLPQSCLEHRR